MQVIGVDGLPPLKVNVAFTDKDFFLHSISNKLCLNQRDIIQAGRIKMGMGIRLKEAESLAGEAGWVNKHRWDYQARDENAISGSGWKKVHRRTH